MGVIVETANPHLEIEFRRESFIIHDDELIQESPEYGYERVFGLQALIAQVIQHPRFTAWLRQKEGQ